METVCSKFSGPVTLNSYTPSASVPVVALPFTVTFFVMMSWPVS